MKTHKTRVALLVGGPSNEHEASLASGKVVHANLHPAKYDVVPLVISRTGEWTVDVADLPGFVDVAFIAMHGEYGEDGTVQELLKEINLPYTGSDHLASALGMNKILSSRLFRAHGMNTPKSLILRGHELSNLDLDSVDLPAVVKPSNRGSSVGVGLARTASELKNMMDRALSYSSSILVEEYIPGRELTCSVIDDGLGNAFPLPVMQVSRGYTNRPLVNTSPPAISSEEAGMAQAVALRAHQLVGASGLSSLDMILGEDGNLYVLEIDTIPVMAEMSPFTQAAIAHGLTLPELFDRIIEAAFIRHASIKSR
ncbi:MAG: ATP-grasp domain-containing protein [bacterium]|nr:ATP-grasp domain-containing protein [bacterium]